MRPSKILSRGILNILIDSKSLSESYADNLKSLDFLHYNIHNFFDIKRTPHETGLEIIDSLPKFKNNIEVSKNRGSIEFTVKKSPVCVGITRNLSAVEDVAKRFFEKRIITKDEWQKIWNIFVYVNLHYNHGSTIYITGDDIVLQKRDWFSYDPFRNPTNIVTVEEGKEIMDIFAKNLKTYLIGPRRELNMHYYYWISFISKIPHYLSPTTFTISDTDTVPLHTLAVRFNSLLKCVDKMGMGYYSGNNIDAISETRFYFNYFIILAAGILDSLATETKRKYKIDVNDEWLPNKNSLNANKSGDDLITIIKEKNCDLYNHIKSNIELINMIRRFRNPAVHGNFRVPENCSNIYDILMQVDSNTKRALSHLKNKKSRYNDYSDWGLIKRANTEYISIYVFSKKMTLSLINFVDLYLEKLKLTGYKIGPAENEQLVQQFQKEKLGL